MKKIVASGLVAGGIFLWAQNTSGPAVHPHSGVAGFLMSPAGHRVLGRMRTPIAQALRMLLGEPAGAGLDPALEIIPQQAASAAENTAQSGCGTVSGTRFNLEARTPPGGLPQNEPAVDFLPGAGTGGADLIVGGANDFRGAFQGLANSLTGYYVHRNGADSNPCTPDFEGGLPKIVDRATGETLLGGGDAAVQADPARAAFFIADTRLGQASSTIGLFRATAANLNNPGTCPNGTHTAAMAGSCWPQQVEVNPFSNGNIDVKPHLASDQRSLGSGSGAGDVYVAAVVATQTGDHIFLAACKNDLSACSPGAVISGADANADFAHVRIRPDAATHPAGSVTVTYVNILTGGPPDFRKTFDLKYVTCTPAGAPSAPVCAAPSLVTAEAQPLSTPGGGYASAGLSAAQFTINTYPKHEHRQDANGVETYIVWDRCKVPVLNAICPDADVVMTASNNNGQTWTAGNVDTGKGDQYFPWIASDPVKNTLTIVYYSAQADRNNHRAQVLLRQIPPGPATPDQPGGAQVITSLPMEPAADFFLGDTFIGQNIGVAARPAGSSSRAYVHYMHNVVNGVYNGVPAPEQNNHLSRFDY